MGDLNGFDLKKILEGSTSEKIYDEFNNTVSSEDYKKHCNAIFNSPNENTKLKDLCYKYERNINKLANEQDKVRARDRCYHSMCWIFDEIRKIFRSNSYNSNHLDVLKKFHDVEERIIKDIHSTIDEKKKKYLCRSYFSYHNLEERENVKYLHDYIKNYDQIKKNMTSGNTDCRMYRKYVEFIKILYTKHKEECCNHWNTECHKYFSCDPFYDPDKLFPVLESCGNGKSKSLRHMGGASLGKISKNSSDDSEKEINMKIKNVRCVAYKYEDYGFLSCFDTPITHNITIKGDEMSTSKTINETSTASRSRGLEFFTRSTLGIPKKVYKVEKGDIKKSEPHTFNIIKGMKNSRCKIIGEDETQGIVELKCSENSYTPNSHVETGQGDFGQSTDTPLTPNEDKKKTDETLVWKRLKQSKEEACNTDLLGFCIDPQNANRNKAREEKIEYKSSSLENEIQYNSDTSHFTNSEMENSVLSSLYTKIGLVSALVLGSFLVFLMYYKYTPVGLWMGRKKVNKRANTYIHHEDYRSQISNHEAKDINMPKKRVRIAYNPA